MTEKFVVMSRGRKIRDKKWGEWGILYGERFPYTLDTAERVLAEEIRIDSGAVYPEYEYEYRIQSTEGRVVEESTLSEKIGQYVAAGHGYNLSVDEAKVVSEVFDVNDRLESELDQKKKRLVELETDRQTYIDNDKEFMAMQMHHAIAALEPEVKLLERILHG